MADRTFKIVLAVPGDYGRTVRAVLKGRPSIEVRTAHDAKGVLALAEKHELSLVILGDGEGLVALEACRLLRSAREHRTVPVVLITEDDGEESRKEAQEAGANAIIPSASGVSHTMYVVSELLRLPPRRRVRFAAVVGVVTLRGARESLARAVNLSDGGIGIETGNAHPVGTPITVQFIPPGERQFRSRAVVRWVRRISEKNFQMGLEFTEMTAEDQKRLLNYLERAPST